MAGLAKVFNGHILNKSDEEVDLTDGKYKGKVIGLYFSAHWCPPCRAFTPKLIDFYNKNAEEKKFEIIFLSSDSDQESFDDYYKDMPWLKLDYKEQDKKDELEEKYAVNGIPTFILLDGDSGDVICTDARKQIQEKDKDGDKFPWNSKEKSDKKEKSDDKEKEAHSKDCLLM